MRTSRSLPKALLLLALPAVVLAAPVHDFGCLFSSGPGQDGMDGWRAAGPVVEWRSSTNGVACKAIRPFFLREQDGRGRDMLDILWPVGTVSHWQGQTAWRFLTAFGRDRDSAGEDSSYRVWALPLVFWGRDRTGETYAAVFPLGGRIDRFLGRDIRFCLFPLYSHSRLNDLDTHNILWPFVSWTKGDDVDVVRAFPFYGRSTKAHASQKRFVMWPFWTSVRYDCPGAEGTGYALFPLWGRVKLANQETWMFLPPFIRSSRGRDGHEGYYPWPFIQTASGKEDRLYLWPLYGRRSGAGAERTFWFWPFVWARHERRAATRVDSLRVFPLYYAEATRTTNVPERVVDRYVSVWPLGSYVRTGAGYGRVRLLDLWPFRDSAGVERDLAPWWTLCRYERRGAGREGEVLWGLARWGYEADGTEYGSVFPAASWSHDAAHDTHREWAFLKGLIGYRRDGTGRRVRFLYLPYWRMTP